MIGVISTNKVDFPFWDDEGKKAITEIYRVKNKMQNVGVRLKTNDISNEDFSVFLDNVYETLKYWTGHTYIGQKKDKALQKAYQTFFEALYKFLFICRELGNPMGSKIGLTGATVTAFLKTADLLNQSSKEVKEKKGEIQKM